MNLAYIDTLPALGIHRVEYGRLLGDLALSINVLGIGASWQTLVYGIRFIAFVVIG